MTKDYTYLGTQRQAPAPVFLAANQRIVLAVISLASVGFFAAGIWLIMGARGPFPAESAPLIGYAFIAASLVDVGIVLFLKRFWEKSGRSHDPHIPPHMS